MMEDKQKEITDLFNVIQDKIESIRIDLTNLNVLVSKKDENIYNISNIDKQRFLNNFFISITDNKPYIYLDYNVYEFIINKLFPEKYLDMFYVRFINDLVQRYIDTHLFTKEFINKFDVSHIIYDILTNDIRYDILLSETNNINIIMDENYTGFTFIFHEKLFVIQLNDNNIINVFINNEYKPENINKDKFEKYLFTKN